LALQQRVGFVPFRGSAVHDACDVVYLTESLPCRACVASGVESLGNRLQCQALTVQNKKTKSQFRPSSPHPSAFSSGTPIPHGRNYKSTDVVLIGGPKRAHNRSCSQKCSHPCGSTIDPTESRIQRCVSLLVVFTLPFGTKTKTRRNTIHPYHTLLVDHGNDWRNARGSAIPTVSEREKHRCAGAAVVTRMM
jgi:hypothetical protein